MQIGNREPKFQGGWNNTLTWKNFTFNMLWEFRVGGHVYNGTQYAMTVAGTSKLTENRDYLKVSGVVQTGGTKDNPIYEDRTFEFEAGKTYQYNGKTTSGETIINGYWQTYYARESAKLHEGSQLSPSAHNLSLLRDAEVIARKI